MRPALACILVAAIGPGATAQFGQFTWTQKGNPSGFAGVTEDGMRVVGPDFGYCNHSHATWMETVLPYPAQVSVLVNYDSLDEDYCYVCDAPGWVLDGEFFKPDTPVSPGWKDGLYAFDFVVLAGQPFGFGIWSIACNYGPGVGLFSDLVVTPLPWATVGEPIDLQTGPVTSGTLAGRVGDVDGDGHADFITGKPGGPGGTVEVVSGKDGAILFSKTGTGNLGDSIVGPGDINGDGVADFVAGAPVENPFATGAVHAWSGSDKAELYAVKGSSLEHLGTQLAGPGDLDGDGLADVVASSLKQVKLLGGPDGHDLGAFKVTAQTGVSALAGPGDVDLDGYPDILVGTFDYYSPVGRMELYSGATHVLMLQIVGGDDFAGGISGAGDLDQDGTPDLLASEQSWKSGGITVGTVVAYPGAGGEPLLRVEGVPTAPLGPAVAGASDLTGDGALDIVTATKTTSPELQVRDGSQGGVVAVFGDQEAPYGYAFTAGVAILGDVDAAGLDDLALCTTSVQVFQALDKLGAPSLVGLGDVAGGEPVTLAVAGGLPGAAGLLIVGASGVQLPLLGGVLQPHRDSIVPLVILGDGSAQFQGRWPMGLPQYTSFWLQAWIPDPAGPQGWTCTNGLVVTQLGT